MDQKANCFRSYGMLQAYSKVVGLRNVPGLMWHKLSIMGESASISVEGFSACSWSHISSGAHLPIALLTSENTGSFPLDFLPAGCCLFELPPHSVRTEEIVEKEAQYRAFSEEQLKNIDTVSRQGQRQPPREVKEAISTNLAVIITNAAKNDKTLNFDWVLRHPDPLSEEEEISERFTAAYLDVGTLGASTLGRGNRQFCILRTPSLSCMPWRDQGGFDKYFLGINRHRYPMKDYLDRVDQIIRSPRNPGTLSDTIKVDPFMAMSLLNFKEYGSFIGHRGILAFAHGQPYSISLNGSIHAQVSLLDFSSCY
uniref:Uncharacterized protein n=1 Tax=Cannabis sativa TaxID=3483 RepID=A0A803QHH3_CANSA